MTYTIRLSSSKPLYLMHDNKYSVQKVVIRTNTELPHLLKFLNKLSEINMHNNS